MKKYSKTLYIIFALIILLLGFFIYRVSGKNGADEDVKDKTLSEIKFLESKFLDLFNQLNNISFENYTISSTQIKQDKSQKQQSAGESSSGESTGSGDSSSSEGDESSGESEGGDGQSSDSQSSGDKEGTSEENNKKFELKENGVLTQDADINWRYIKNEVEKIYTSLYSTTLDLYQTSSNQEDIVNFNKEFDNLTKAVKDENKEDALMELSLLYNYLPKFIDKCTDEDKEKIVIKTKNDIFKAYSVLDKEEWSAISQNINDARQNFTKLVTNINTKQKGNQYNINKAYIMINELQNAVVLKDKEVFLIKYKNLVEELQNM